MNAFMHNGIILIVDDEPRNTKLMKAMLMPEGYEIFEVLSGEEALKAVPLFSPDLILLDVMMPGMNGFEVCRHLKNDDRTKVIPIIMVTALQEQVHQLTAMEAGADDFVSKPVDRIELLIRVKSLLRIKKYHDELLFSYIQIAQKNKKLEELEQMKEGLIHMIIHDLRNPLTAASALIEISLMDKERFSEKQLLNFAKSIDYCNEMNEQIENLLSIHRMENAMLSIEACPTDIVSLFKAAADQVRAKAESKEISLSCIAQEDIPAVNMDGGLIKRVIANLVSNAIRHAPFGSCVEGFIKFKVEDQKVLVGVKDSGDGLAPEYHEKVFDKFEQVKLKREGISVGSSGLGLAFCKMAVEAHGGKIWVESEGEGKGCTFLFLLPVHSTGGGENRDAA
jgi:two-component system, sensor histidine kinase and response regulator